jgi:hypothetical protein
LPGRVKENPITSGCDTSRVFSLAPPFFFTSGWQCGNARGVGLLIIMLAVVALALFERQIGGSGG